MTWEAASVAVPMFVTALLVAPGRAIAHHGGR